MTALQGRWRVQVSKSVTKEPRCRHPGKRNVGIMRFRLAGSVPFWAFVTDLDTVGRLVGEDGGPLGPFSSAGPTGLDSYRLTSPEVSVGHVYRLCCLRHRLQRRDVVELFAQGPALKPELVVALQVHPELGRRAEVLGQSYSGVGGDTALAVHDLVDAARGHADGRGEFVLGDPEPLDEVLHEDLARVNRVDPVSVSGSRRARHHPHLLSASPSQEVPR